MVSCDSEGNWRGARVRLQEPRPSPRRLPERARALATWPFARDAAGGGAAALGEEPIHVARGQSVLGELERQPHGPCDLEHGGEADAQDRSLTGGDTRALGGDQRGG